MSEPRRCPRCGAVLGREGEPCPRCLLELGRSTPEPPGSKSGSGAGAARPKKRASPSVEEIAKRFPELEIAARIGEGGMGAVYKARQPRIERWVALKVLALDPVDDPTFAERFRREAMVLARLDHPNVVKLYDFGEREGLFYLVLEYVDGTNLRTLMKQSLLAPAQALAIVPQMCTALQFAHDEGIVHRDIKPENVLVDAKGRVKIADFGLAKLVDADARDVSLTEVGQVMGTPHYMAPEQLRGSHEVDHRADIYSLGVVFYEMLTGELPRGNFELPSKRVHVDVRLDEIVLKSLERTPERRYQHAVEVKTDVESVGAGRPETPPETPAYAGISIRMGAAKGGKRRVVVHPSKPWEFFVTFLLVWPLVGLAFNGGAWSLALAMLFVAAVYWSHLEQSILARPELSAALKDEPRGARALRHVAALLLLATGLFSLFAGHVAAFGSLCPGYRGSPVNKYSLPHVDPDAVTQLEKELNRDPRTEVRISKLRLQGYWYLDHEDLWTSDILIVLAPILLAGAAFALTWRRGHWKPAFSAIGILLGPLLLLETSTLVLGSAEIRSGRLEPIVDRSSPLRFETSGTEDLSRRLRIALVEREFAVTGEGKWTLADPQDPSKEHELQVLTAEPASPFDRWRISWGGPVRVKPRAVFRILGPREGGPALLTSDLGDAPAESPLRHSALDGLAATLQRVREP